MGTQTHSKTMKGATLFLLLLPSLCLADSCCSTITLHSTGMGDFYQGERLGEFLISGSNFLFFLPGEGVWMVGPNVGQDYGGVLNREGGLCPETLTQDWEYYRDWTDSWEQDWSLEVTCGTDGPTPDPDGEPCTWGEYCEGCAIWNEHDGVKYCCANNCDYGSVDVSTSNGEVVCTCHH